MSPIPSGITIAGTLARQRNSRRPREQERPLSYGQRPTPRYQQTSTRPSIPSLKRMAQPVFDYPTVLPDWTCIYLPNDHRLRTQSQSFSLLLELFLRNNRENDPSLTYGCVTIVGSPKHRNHHINVEIHPVHYASFWDAIYSQRPLQGLFGYPRLLG